MPDRSGAPGCAPCGPGCVQPGTLDHREHVQVVQPPPVRPPSPSPPSPLTPPSLYVPGPWEHSKAGACPGRDPGVRDIAAHNARKPTTAAAGYRRTHRQRQDRPGAATGGARADRSRLRRLPAGLPRTGRGHGQTHAGRAAACAPSPDRRGRPWRDLQRAPVFRVGASRDCRHREARSASGRRRRYRLLHPGTADGIPARRHAARSRTRSRLIRALEIAESQRHQPATNRSIPAHVLGLEIEPATLAKRIAQRTECIVRITLRGEGG